MIALAVTTVAGGDPLPNASSGAGQAPFAEAAPTSMVVAHWINAECNFPALNPDILSAGDRTAHNVVADPGDNHWKSALPAAPGSAGPLPAPTPRRTPTVHETWELTQTTRIALVTSGEDVAAAEDPFSEVGASEFTAVSNVSGPGHRGHHQGSSLLNQRGVFTLSTVVLPAERNGVLLEAPQEPSREPLGRDAGLQYAGKPPRVLPMRVASGHRESHRCRPQPLGGERRAAVDEGAAGARSKTPRGAHLEQGRNGR